MTVKTAVSADVRTLYQRTHTVEGQPVAVTFGATDARYSIRLEGPGPGEFVFLTVHPNAFAALCRGVIEISTAPAQEIA